MFTQALFKATAVCLSPDEQYIYTGSIQGKIVKWNMSTQQEEKIYRHSNSDFIELLVYMPDSFDPPRLFSVVGERANSTILVWDERSGHCVCTFVLQGPMYRWAVSPRANVVCWWDCEFVKFHNMCRTSFCRLEVPVTAMAYSSSHLFVASDWTYYIYALPHAGHGHIVTQIDNLTGWPEKLPHSPIIHLHVSKNDTLLFVCLRGGWMGVWEIDQTDRGLRVEPQISLRFALKCTASVHKIRESACGTIIYCLEYEGSPLGIRRFPPKAYARISVWDIQHGVCLGILSETSGEGDGLLDMHVLNDEDILVFLENGHMQANPTAKEQVWCDTWELLLGQ